MDNEIFFILQKFGIETIFLGGLVCLLCFFTNKILNKKIKKISLYLPYFFGIVLYFLYSAIFKTIEADSVFNCGITIGAIGTIILSFFKKQTEKTTLADDVLKGIVPEKNFDEIKQKIQNASLEEIADIISQYSIYPISYDQCKIFAEIIIFSQKEET